MRELIEQLGRNYESLNEIHRLSEGPRDLERKLRGFKGIGAVTVNIPLRELRAGWDKADPEPLDRVRRTADQFGIDRPAADRQIASNGIRIVHPVFITFENFLINSPKRCSTQ